MTGRSSNDVGREATTKKALTHKASDVLPLSLYLTNAVFFMLFFFIVYYLLYRWCDKIRNSTPRHVVTLSEILAIVSLFASYIYLLRLRANSVGVAGPLLLDGFEYTIPMATNEGCLVVSTNKGCKSIYASGRATSIVLRDGMTTTLVVRFATAKRAAKLKFYLEDPLNFDILAIIFNRSSRFARLQSIHCSIAGRNLHLRFSCSIGDAMGMNVVSKGLQNVLDFLQNYFLDMDVIGISGKQLAPSYFCCYLLEPQD